MNPRETIERYKKFKIPSLYRIFENARQYSKTCLLIAIIFFLIIIYLIQQIPHWQVAQFELSNSTEVANLENQYRATLAQILGGIAVVIGIYFAWGNLKVAQSTFESNQENTKRSLEVVQEGQITERFTRAVDQLGAIDQSGNPSVEIRLGGIYALERIANESKKDYWPIMEILTAYIRKNSSIKDQKVQERERVQFDIQAILSVIKKRNKPDNFIEPCGLDLQDTYLCKTNLSNTYLEGADLTGADLTEAHLEGACLRKAHLEGADLTGADLTEAHLEGAHLTKYDKTEYDYDESGCISGYSIIKEANLNWAHLRKAHLEGAYLRQAHLEGADLTEAHLEGADLTEAHLEGADLTEAHFEMTDFMGAHLDGANFTKVDLKDDTSNSTILPELIKKSYNLTSDQLSKVKTLRGAKLNEKIKAELREKNSALIEEIDGG